MNISKFFGQSAVDAALKKEQDISFLAVQIYQFCKASNVLGSLADVVLLNLSRQIEGYAEITVEDNIAAKRMGKSKRIRADNPLTIRVLPSGRVSILEGRAESQIELDSFSLDIKRGAKDMVNNVVRYLINDPKGIFQNTVYNFARGMDQAPIKRVDLK